MVVEVEVVLLIKNAIDLRIFSAVTTAIVAEKLTVWQAEASAVGTMTGCSGAGGGVSRYLGPPSYKQLIACLGNGID